MNELGSILLVLSAALLLFSTFLALPGIKWLSASSLTQGILKLTGSEESNRTLRLAQRGVLLNFALASGAFLILLLLMVTGDFSNRYVASLSSADLELIQKLIALGSGPGGKLLFTYALALALTVLTLRRLEKSDTTIRAMFLSWGGLAILFLAAILIFAPEAQPFRKYHSPLPAGLGLSPALNNLLALFWPLLLQAGYITLFLPGALTASALLSGSTGHEIRDDIVRSSRLAWFLIGSGVVISSYWSYLTQGVGEFSLLNIPEPIALLPLLLTTIFLHTYKIEEHKQRLLICNRVIPVLMLSSGVVSLWSSNSSLFLSGSNSFTPLDLIFALLLLYTTFSGLLAVLLNRNLLKQTAGEKFSFNRAGALALGGLFLLTELILLTLGTFFTSLQPLTETILTLCAILTFLLIGVATRLEWSYAGNPALKKALLWPALIGVVAVALFATATTLWLPDPAHLSPLERILPILLFGAATALLTIIVQELSRGLAKQGHRDGEGVTQALFRLINSNQSRYGGYFVHLALVIIALGVSGNSFKKGEEVNFHYSRGNYQAGTDEVFYNSNDKAYVDGYEIHARELFVRPHFNFNADSGNPAHLTVSQEAHFSVWKLDNRRNPSVRSSYYTPYEFANLKDESKVKSILEIFPGITFGDRIKTEKRFQPLVNPLTGRIVSSQSEQSRPLVGFMPARNTAWNEDLYLQLVNISEPTSSRTPDLVGQYQEYYFETGRQPNAYYSLFPVTMVATFTVWINPFVKLIWFGFLILILAGILLAIPGRRESAQQAESN